MEVEYRMDRRARIAVTLALLSLAVAATGRAQVAPDSSAIPQATAAAQTWLHLLDAGDYGASWDQAAPLLQQAVTKPAWVAAAHQARDPFEPFGDRTFSEATYQATLPNAPPGPYVIVKYQTAVSGGRTVTETVVPMRLPDGSWRVSGYFVRPAS
jgi:hypothetical protein